MATTIGSRLAYEKAKDAINKAGFSVSQAVLSQGYIRSEIALATNKTNYTFGILANDNTNGAPFNTEVRLQLQDAFYCSALFIGFAAPSSGTATDFQLYSYPNKTAFTTNAPYLNSFYNGTLSVTVNNRQIVPNYPVYSHYDVPQMQQTANADYTTSAINYLDQQKGTMSGVVPIEPGWVFVGSKNNVFSIQLPSALTAVLSNSRVVVQMFGHLAQNVTPVR